MGAPEDEDADPALKLAQSLFDSRRIVVTLVPSTNDSAYYYQVFLVWLTKHAAGFDFDFEVNYRVFLAVCSHSPSHWHSKLVSAATFRCASQCW